MDALSFPSFEIKFSPKLPDEIVLMLLGGRSVAPEWLAAIDFYSSVWAVDSGLNLCRNADIVPDRLIGDMDSVDPSAKAWAVGKGAEVYSYASEKDLTDFQIALELLVNQSGAQLKGVFLTGAFGGRFDHLISVLNSFTGWSESYLPVGMADENEAMFLLRGGCRAEITFKERPAAVSLIPLHDSSGVSIGNVRWPLERVSLERSKPYSISNRACDGSVTASVEDGLVGLYCAGRGTWQ